MTEVLNELERIRDFLIGDLRKTDDKASANFLVCVGCLNGTEVLGGVETGLIGSNESGAVVTRLKAGLGVLGSVYKNHEQDFVDLRHSMVHAYLGKVRNYTNVDIANKKDPSAGVIPQGAQVVNGRFVINVSRWIEDLDTAWSVILNDIRVDPSKAGQLGRVLSQRLPFLR